MSSNEFADWMAFYQLNPFGVYRADINAATIAATIANANAAKGKKFTIKDFLPEFKAAQEEKTSMPAEEVISFFQRMQQGIP